MQVRDGPAAVRGDAPPPKATGLTEGPGRRWGRVPRVRRPAALLHIPNPSWKEDSWYDVCSFSSAAIGLVLALAAAALGATVTVRVEGQDAVDLRLGARQDRRRQRAAGARRGQHARRVLLPAHAPVVRRLREPDRQVPGRRRAPAGCSRSTASRRPSVRTRSCSRTATRALVLRHVRRHGRAADARPEGAGGNCYTSPSVDDAGKRRRSPAPRSTSTAAGSRRSSTGAPVSARTRVLVRAFAVGAVRSNAVK